MRVTVFVAAAHSDGNQKALPEQPHADADHQQTRGDLEDGVQVPGKMYWDRKSVTRPRA